MARRRVSLCANDDYHILAIQQVGMPAREQVDIARTRAMLNEMRKLKRIAQKAIQPGQQLTMLLMYVRLSLIGQLDRRA